MVGRPSKYTPELAAEICEQIADGNSLRKICAASDMPARRTVEYWLRDKDDFLRQYARAREEQADFYADEIIEIADTETDSNIARVRIDARKWVASKLKPKKYGEKVQNEHSGQIGIREILNDIRGDELTLPE